MRSYGPDLHTVIYAKKLTPQEIQAFVDVYTTASPGSAAHLDEVFAGVSGHDVTDESQLLNPPANIKMKVPKPKTSPRRVSARGNPFPHYPGGGRPGGVCHPDSCTVGDDHSCQDWDPNCSYCFIPDAYIGQGYCV